MSDQESEYTAPWVRHAILWAGFAVLVVVGIWTVVLPAVEDSPVDPDTTREEAESGEAAADEEENSSDSNN